MKPVAVVLVLFAAVAAMSGQVTQKQEPRRTWVVAVGELSPPPALRVVMAPFGAGYEGTAPLLGLAVDLNRDETDDYILQGHREECGTGGCSYWVFDGAAARRIGDLGGNRILVRAEVTRGFPNLETIGWAGAQSGFHQTYTFDGKAYVERSKRRLQGSAYWALTRAWEKFPRGLR